MCKGIVSAGKCIQAGQENAQKSQEGSLLEKKSFENFQVHKVNYLVVVVRALV
jgi:hypothetical protein